jgi:hypothetical protein
MPFTINEFTSELSKHGVVKASDFSVIITAPPAVSNGAESWLPLRIEAVNIPSRTLMTIEQRYHGPTRFMPYSFIHTPVSLTVILSEDMRERDFFMRWQDLAVTKDGMGLARTSSVPDPSGGGYDSNYYDDAVKPGRVEIQQYPGSAEAGDTGTLGAALGVARSIGLDPTIITRPLGFDIGLTPAAKPPKPKTKILLNECFPRTVQDLSMNWANGDELAKLQVELVYFDITEVYEGPEDGGNGFGDSSTGLPGMIRKGVNTLNKFRPLISGIRSGGMKNAVVGGAGSSLGNAGANLKVF